MYKSCVSCEGCVLRVLCTVLEHHLFKSHPACSDASLHDCTHRHTNNKIRRGRRRRMRARVPATSRQSVATPTATAPRCEVRPRYCISRRQSIATWTLVFWTASSGAPTPKHCGMDRLRTQTPANRAQTPNRRERQEPEESRHSAKHLETWGSVRFMG